MKKSIFEAFGSKTAQGYIDTRQYSPRVFPSFFPIRQTAFLSYETLIGSQGRPVAGDVIAFDTKAPEKTRKVIGTLKGDIPKIAISRVLNEGDINKIIQLNALIRIGSDSAMRQLRDMIYDDPDFCMEGCYTRMEWLCLQALSQGYISLTTSNNNGLVTVSNIDFQLPAANKRCIKSASSNRTWIIDNIATMTPLTDIRVVVDAFRSVGIRFEYVLMDYSTFSVIAQSTQLIQSIPNVNTAVRVPTLTQVNEVLKFMGLPSIILLDSYIDIEDTAGVKTTTNCWNTDYVSFVPQLNLGNVLSGPIADFDMAPEFVTKARNKDGVALLKYGEVNPVKEITVGYWNAFPTFPTIDKMIRYKVGAYASTGLEADA